MYIDTVSSRSIPFRVKPKHIITLLLIGGLISLTEISGRLTILGSYNVDAARNLLLITIAILAVFIFILQRGGAVPSLVPLLPYLLFVGWALFSFVWSSELQYSLREASKLIYPVFFFFLVRLSLRTKADAYFLYTNIRTIFYIFAVFGIGAATVGVALMMRDGSWQWGTSRLLKIPLQMETMAACTFILIEFVGWRILPKWKPNKVMLIIMIVYVFLSLTRAYIFGLLLAMAIVFAVTSKWRFIWPLFITIGCIFIISLLVIDNPVKTRMFWKPEQVTVRTIVEMAATTPSELFSPEFIKFSGRIAYFQVTLNEAQERRSAFIGAGLGSSRPIINMYFPDATVAHGDYLSYLAELGYIGFGLLLLLYFTTFWGNFYIAMKKRSDPIKRAASTLLLSLTALVIVVSLVYNAFVHVFVLHTVATAMLGIVSQSTKPSMVTPIV